MVSQNIEPRNIAQVNTPDTSYTVCKKFVHANEELLAAGDNKGRLTLISSQFASHELMLEPGVTYN